MVKYYRCAATGYGSRYASEANAESKRVRRQEELMNEQDNEITISLGDMLAYFLHRWKLICIVSIIFMGIIGGYLIYKQNNEIENKYADTTYKGMIKDMTQEQLKTVDLFYTRYKTFKERIAENRFYSDNSLLMKIDSNNVSILTKEYLVKSNYSGVADSFGNVALDLDDFEKMAKVLGDDVDARYVNELVSLNGGVGQNSYRIDTDKVGDVINGSIDYTYTGILTLRVTANSRSDCEKIAQIADAAVKEHMEALKNADIEVELSELTNAYTEKVDTGIAEAQRSTAEQGSQLVTDYYNFEKNAKASMDAQESAVFDYLIDKEQEVKERLHIIRYLAIGLVVGGVLIVIILAICYLFASAVKTFDDVERLTKEKGIGVVVQPTKSKIFLGKLFHNWAKKIEFHGVNKIPEEDAIALICDRIRSLCEGKDAKKVFLASDSDYAYSNTVLSRMLTRLKNMGIEASTGTPTGSLEALQKLRQSDVAVIAVTMKNSLPSVVRDEYAVCEENHVPVVANFVIYPQR